jgi:hypothetical protein
MAVGIPAGQSLASKASKAFVRWARQLTGKTPPQSAEESFANFASQWGFSRLDTLPRGQAQTLRELWEMGGSPYINVSPQVQSPGKRGRAAFTTLEGTPELFQGGDFIFQDVGNPTYVEEERVPVDTIHVGKRDIKDFFAELAHAKQFGPDVYQYQYPEGTPYGEIPSDWPGWAQPTDKQSLNKLAQRRADLYRQTMEEDILHGQAKYDPPAPGDNPTREYAAHGEGGIEQQLEALYEEKYAPREQADQMELFLRGLKTGLLLMGGVSQIGTGGFATGPQALLPWRRDEGEYGK